MKHFATGPDLPKRVYSSQAWSLGPFFYIAGRDSNKSKEIYYKIHSKYFLNEDNKWQVLQSPEYHHILPTLKHLANCVRLSYLYKQI